MNARLRWWLHEWDWRTFVRLLVWLGLGVSALERSGFHPPSLGSFARESALAFLLTGGLMTQAQLWALMLTTNLYFWLDARTYALAEWITRPLTERASFAGEFVAALAVQLGLVFGTLMGWRAAHLGPRVLVLVEGTFQALLRVVT